MWTRDILKAKAREKIYANYWKAVLVAFILGSLVAAGSGGSHHGTAGSEEPQFYEMSQYGTEYQMFVDRDEVWWFGWNFMPDVFHMKPFVKQILGMTAGLFMVAAALLRIFLLNPLEVGGAGFFSRNLRKKAEIKELLCAFDRNYLNVVLTMFLRNLYTLLWLFLLVIPGIVKAYEYRMIPYILAEHPEMSRQQVFALSREMMYGNKWDAFVLDLSFLGWVILSALTCGILNIFYVNPYRYQTDAALYQFLKEEKEYQS